MKCLTILFNRLLVGGRITEEWRRSVLIPIYKNKGDAQCCEKWKLQRNKANKSHIMKVWERIIEARLRDIVEISKSSVEISKIMDLCQEREPPMPCLL